MADERIYMLQPSFAAGEISPDVAARVDLDKYQSSLLQAKNCFVRPYGSVYRRPGMLYKATLEAGYEWLQEFAVNADTSYLLEFREAKLRIWKDETGTLTLKATLTTPFGGGELKRLRFAQSADVMFIASGSHPVQVLTRHSDTSWTIANMALDASYYDVMTATEGVTISASGTTGNVTLTASGSIFASGQVGNWIRLDHDMPAETKSQSGTGTSASMLAGAEGWKVISHGTWAGSFSVEYSKDNTNWKTLRTYTSNSDYNPTESGTFDEPTYIRVTASLSSGSITIDLTRLPYTHHGTVKLTGYTSATVMTGTVVDKLAGTSTCDDYAFGPWCAAYGYPACVTFFQDRLCFAASNKYPYMVWMSRSGDYFNFGTEEVSGTLTDDSAIALSFISRQDYRILHMVATSDLVIMTEGNEWIISGNSTVTPTKVTPQLQTFRGCTDVLPVIIGNDVIYVQRHGKTVRDMQYNYASDSYDGTDLTLLAKHITKSTMVIDAAYKQEPDYMMFFVLADGTCACLTFIKDQKVYAWSRITTQGKIKAVCALSNELDEDIYFVVERGSTNYIEKLAEYPESEYPEDYVMLDFAAEGGFVDPSNTITVTHLAGKTVDVLADGDHHEQLTADANGVITLPDETVCLHYVVGLPYTSVLELPNVELQLRDGSMQGRRKKVSEVILRLSDSLGGSIGVEEPNLDHINYDEYGDQVVKLYSGDKRVSIPNIPIGGNEETGRVVIRLDSPYPFNLSSIVRVVTLGG